MHKKDDTNLIILVVEGLVHSGSRHKGIQRVEQFWKEESTISCGQFL